MSEIREFEKVVSYFMMEGYSLLLSGRAVGIMLPLSEVERTESGSVAEVDYDPKQPFSSGLKWGSPSPTMSTRMP